jgi:photoactive yellow protein
MSSGFYSAVQSPIEAEVGPIDAIERLAAMSQDEVDDLPYGFVVLDGEGKILLYNRYESRLSRIAPDRVVGKNFFREVAPCTRVEAFYGRFRALVDSADRMHDSFGFRFFFMHGVQDVAVQFVKAPPVTTLPLAASGSPVRVFMTVVRRPVAEEVEPSRPSAPPGDLRRALGSIGGLLPVLLDALPGMLERLGPVPSLELGQHVGRALALVIETEASAAVPGSLPAVLAPGALDGALARAGLGRLSMDGSSWPGNRVLRCSLRPPFENPTSETAVFYCALLSAAIGTGLAEPHRARVADGFELSAGPWHFEVAPGVASERPPAAGARMGVGSSPSLP